MARPSVFITTSGGLRFSELDSTCAPRCWAREAPRHIWALWGRAFSFVLALIPLMPYVEGLVGAGNVQVGGAASVVSKTALAYEGVAGIDWTILPRLDWRIVEFSAGGFSSLNASISPRTWSTGLVLRLP